MVGARRGNGDVSISRCTDVSTSECCSVTPGACSGVGDVGMC